MIDELQTVSGQTLLTSDSPITLTVTCDDGLTQVTETIVVTVGNLVSIIGLFGYCKGGSQECVIRTGQP